VPGLVLVSMEERGWCNWVKGASYAVSSLRQKNGQATTEATVQIDGWYANRLTPSRHCSLNSLKIAIFIFLGLKPLLSAVLSRPACLADDTVTATATATALLDGLMSSAPHIWSQSECRRLQGRSGLSASRTACGIKSYWSAAERLPVIRGWQMRTAHQGTGACCR